MRKRLRIAFVLLLAIIVIGLFGAWSLVGRTGRTPDEIISYAEGRVQGNAVLESVGSPVLRGLRSWFGEPEYAERYAPFSIPALPPNPATGKEPVPSQPVVPGADLAGKQSPGSDARIIRVGKSRNLTTIGAAADFAKDGDIVEIDAGDYHADVAIWRQARLTIRGVGGRVRLIASGASAEDKAIWVIKGGNFVVENIDFIGTRVPDGNGAGIRFETGRLLVRNCLFFNNENGLLTSEGNLELEIENSEFAYNGKGDGQTHNLYVGNIKSLKVTGSYFHHANVGHLLKSRAARNYIAYNRLTDESGGRASYELEFPNGGVAFVVGNIIEQNVQTRNSTLVFFGAEGYTYSTNELYLVHNTLVNDHPGGGALLRVGPGAYVKTQNNLLVGKGEFHVPDGLQSDSDIRAERDIFAGAAAYDYRLNAKGRQNIITPPTGNVNGVELAPQVEYVHPMRLKQLSGFVVFPGAIQTPATEE
jgi:hypothetical protein